MSYLFNRAVPDEDSDLIVYKTLTSTYTLPESTTKANHEEEDNNISYMEKTTVQAVITKIPVHVKSRTTETTPTSKPSQASITITPIATLTPAPTSETEQQSTIPTQNNGTKVGLAIGIPIALFSLFFICLGVWYYFRSRKSNPFASFREKFNEEDSPNHTLTSLENGEFKMNPYEQDISTLYIKPGAERKLNPNSFKYKWKTRLSRAVSSKDINDEDATISDTPNFMERMSMMTPVFLKRFNLQKSDQNIEPQTIAIPGKTVQKKNNTLFPNLRIGETLDPVQGGVSPGQDLYIVIRSYVKQLSDELTIKIGDKVVILKSYSDGWCTVRMVRTGQDYYRHINTESTGLVPKICLQKV